MNNKTELKKQLVYLSLILVLVAIIAIILNTKDMKITEDVKDNNVQNSYVEEQEILDNLKGLLEEPEEVYNQDETQGTQEKKIKTNSGETIIIKE